MSASINLEFDTASDALAFSVRAFLLDQFIRDLLTRKSVITDIWKVLASDMTRFCKHVESPANGLYDLNEATISVYGYVLLLRNIIPVECNDVRAAEQILRFGKMLEYNEKLMIADKWLSDWVATAEMFVNQTVIKNAIVTYFQAVMEDVNFYKARELVNMFRIFASVIHKHVTLNTKDLSNDPDTVMEISMAIIDDMTKMKQRYADEQRYMGSIRDLD